MPFPTSRPSPPPIGPARTMHECLATKPTASRAEANSPSCSCSPEEKCQPIRAPRLARQTDGQWPVRTKAGGQWSTTVPLLPGRRLLVRNPSSSHVLDAGSQSNVINIGRRSPLANSAMIPTVAVVHRPVELIICAAVRWGCHQLDPATMEPPIQAPAPWIESPPRTGASAGSGIGSSGENRFFAIITRPSPSFAMETILFAPSPYSRNGAQSDLNHSSGSDCSGNGSSSRAPQILATPTWCSSTNSFRDIKTNPCSSRQRKLGSAESARKHASRNSPDVTRSRSRWSRVRSSAPAK